MAATSLDPRLQAPSDAEAAAAFVEELRRIKPVRAFEAEQIEALYAAAHNALLAGSLNQAQALFGMLLLQDPTEVRFLSGMGHVAAQQNDFALASCLHCLAAYLQPDNLRLLLPWAEALMGLGQTGPARLILQAMSLAGADDALSTPSVQRAQALIALLDHD